MPKRNLDEVLALHDALMQVIVSHPGGRNDAAAMTHVSTLCARAVEAVDDLEARLAFNEQQLLAAASNIEQSSALVVLKQLLAFGRRNAHAQLARVNAAVGTSAALANLNAEIASQLRLGGLTSTLDAAGILRSQ